MVLPHMMMMRDEGVEVRPCRLNLSEDQLEELLLILSVIVIISELREHLFFYDQQLVATDSD